MLHYALRPAWTPLTLLLMVLGFIVFWPLGLAMLAYIIWGDRFPDVRRHFSEAGREWQSRSHSGCGRSNHGPRGFTRSGNVAFDDYRERELKRLEEERRRLDDELREFESFMGDLRRARDQEEFDRFMRARTAKRSEGGSSVDL